MKKKNWSRDEAWLNIQKYCASQERCHQEVRYKLLENGIYGDVLEDIIAELISNDFLNEERFATSYARGKFRMKGWGRIKIIHELKSRQVSKYCIGEALKEIDEDTYMETLKTLLDKKASLILASTTTEKVKKLTEYALSKGYEYDLIKSILFKP